MKRWHILSAGITLALIALGLFGWGLSRSAAAPAQTAILPSDTIIPMGSAQADVRTAYRAVLGHLYDGGRVHWAASSISGTVRPGDFIVPGGLDTSADHSDVTATLSLSRAYGLRPGGMAVLSSTVVVTEGQSQIAAMWELAQVRQLLDDYLEGSLSYTVLDETDIVSGGLEGIDLLIVPAVRAGAVLTVTQALAETGALAVIGDFVEAGGVLYAQSNGAYVAEAAGLLPEGTVDLDATIELDAGSEPNRGRMDVQMPDSPLAWSWLTDTLYILSDPVLHPTPEMDVVATLTNALQIDAPAIVRADAGEGQVILVAGHPTAEARRLEVTVFMDAVLSALSGRVELAGDAIQTFNPGHDPHDFPAYERVPVSVTLAAANLWDDSISDIVITETVSDGYVVSETTISPAYAEFYTVTTPTTQTIIVWELGALAAGEEIHPSYRAMINTDTLASGAGTFSTGVMRYTENPGFSEKTRFLAHPPFVLTAQMAARLVGDRDLEAGRQYHIPAEGIYLDVTLPLENKECTTATTIVTDWVYLIHPIVDVENRHVILNANDGETVWMRNEPIVQDSRGDPSRSPYPLPSRSPYPLPCTLDDWQGDWCVFTSTYGIHVDPPSGHAPLTDDYGSFITIPPTFTDYISVTADNELLLPCLPLTFDLGEWAGYRQEEPAVHYSVHSRELFSRAVVFHGTPREDTVVMPYDAGSVYVVAGGPAETTDLYAAAAPSPSGVTYQDVWSRTHFLPFRAAFYDTWDRDTCEGCGEKSLYVIAHIGWMLDPRQVPVEAYGISGDELQYQGRQIIPYLGWGAIDIAIDSEWGYLFITYEQHDHVQLIDARTMADKGRTLAPGAINLAGIEVDEGKQRVYAVDRNTTHLYVYDWYPLAETLELDGATWVTLSGCNGALGIDVDEKRDLLYVTDRDNTIEVYDTDDWSHVDSITVNGGTEFQATGIAVDEERQFLYTSGGSEITGTFELRQYDLAAGSHRYAVSSSAYVLDIDIDLDTGYVYVTTSSGDNDDDDPPNGGSCESSPGDRLIAYDSSLSQLWISDDDPPPTWSQRACTNGDIGNPTGLAVPRRATKFGLSISGQVTGSGGDPIPGATVSTDAGTSATTDASGAYTLTNLIPGTYLLTVSKSGYTFSPAARVVRVPPHATGQDFTTASASVYGSLTGLVTAQSSGAAIAGARVSAGGKVGQTDANGYTLTDIPPGLHNIYVSADGYEDYKGEVVIEAGTSTIKDVALGSVSTDGYYLPYPGGKTYMCTQGNGGQYSHQGKWYYAFDFGMPNGHKVVAARDGQVVAVKENSSTGCNSKACINDANYVRVRHQDGTDTLYYHLKYQSVSVEKDQSVSRGQVIAESDTTGWCTGAHLDFTRHKWGEWTSIPVSFADVSGDGVPKAGGNYTSGNYPTSKALHIAQGTEDTDPPQGSVQFRLTGQPTHTLLLSAFDYITNVTEMRLATTEPGLQVVNWQPFATRATWTAPVAFAQYRDANGNVSAVVSDTVDAIGYETIQAAFAVAPTVCVGRGLSLTNQTTPFCEQCGWLWDFGEGTSSEEAEPQFDYVAVSSFAGYASPGMYTVTLTTTSAVSANSVSHQVEALSTPSADFTMVRSGATITVEAEAAEAAGWTWDFGDGSTATGRTVTHTYSDAILPNPCPVQLVVEGNNGCKSWGHQYVPTYSIYLPLVLRSQ